MNGMTSVQVAPVERLDPGAEGNVFGMPGLGVRIDGDEFLISVTADDGLSLTARLDEAKLDQLAQRLAIAIEEKNGRMLSGDVAIVDAERQLYAIVLYAARRSGAGVRNIIGRNREERIVRIRDAVVWVARRSTKASWPKIGEVLGRDHTTVIEAERRAVIARREDDGFRQFADRLLAEAQAEFGLTSPGDAA